MLPWSHRYILSSADIKVVSITLLLFPPVVILLPVWVTKDTIENDNGIKLELSEEFISNLNEMEKEGIKTSIISTNYDIILDNSLIRKCKSCNYGSRLRNNIFYNPAAQESVRVSGNESYNFETYSGKINRGNIKLLKIHGSLNWFFALNVMR